MAIPYSDDLRAKFIAAYEAGNVRLKRLASTFQVSRAWAEGLADKAGDAKPSRLAESEPLTAGQVHGRKPRKLGLLRSQVVRQVSGD